MIKVKHWDKDMMISLNNILEKYPKGGKVLDVGAGDGESKKLFPSNWEWHGIDFSPWNSNVKKGDAHNLQFPDDSFDLVISIAVFEHLHGPWIAAQEIKRVLKKKGYFLGMVAFLEPEHGNSYFHMTRRGIQHILNQAKFKIDFIEPVSGWKAPVSLKILPLPGFRILSRMRTFFLFTLRSLLINIKIFFTTGIAKERALKFKAEEAYRFSGSFMFLASK